MTTDLLRIAVSLLLGVTAIILLTSRWRVHAFFALLVACFIVGLGCGINTAQTIGLVKEGFGNIMKSLGLIIVLGSTLGIVLEQSGATSVMAEGITRSIGKTRTPLAMTLTGFVVGLPIFCDSGYIVLSGINNKLSKTARVPMAVMAACLGTGLYAVHCLIPPHPGAAAAAGAMGVDFGRLMLFGAALAVPATFVGYMWGRFAGAGSIHEVQEKSFPEDANKVRPSLWFSFLPIAVPILLIALKSFVVLDPATSPYMATFFNVAGDPAVALSAGIVLALLGVRSWHKGMLGHMLADGVEKAGSILMIIGAGGAFGAVLAATRLGDQLTHALNLAAAGLWFPFLITFFLKTAQGSSTVAIITAASIVQPLLPALGLTGEHERLLVVLSMGAGSMMISHVNDAYFWVIARFSGLDLRTMLRVYSVATFLMGLVTFLGVLVLAMFAF